MRAAWEQIVGLFNDHRIRWSMELLAVAARVLPIEGRTSVTHQRIFAALESFEGAIYRGD